MIETRLFTSWRNRIVTGSLMWIGACLFMGSIASAQSALGSKPAVEDRVGWHVVQEGECLESITKSYLGYAQLWRENWRLNPDIENPNKLKPGQRIRVILERHVPTQSADIIRVRRKVERQTVPDPWLPATVGDQLAERDSLRTFDDAFSELLFPDGSTLQVNEASLVFLQRVGQNLVGVHRETVEIVAGQADFAAEFKAQRKRSNIEIILGDAQARPEPDSSGMVATRNRLDQEGSAEIMVFDGVTRVEAAGQTVDVREGMGTVVERGEPPKPPSPLLPGPKLGEPKAGAVLSYQNPRFSWREVPGAVHYTVEVFSDSDGRQPVSRDTGIESARWDASPIGTGSFFWRVTATDGLGLDGFPSGLRRLDINGAAVDQEPPVVVALRIGPGASQGQAIVLGSTSGIRLFAQDDASGVAAIRYRWNQEAWKDYTGEVLTLPHNAAEARLEFQARDHVGTWSAPQSVRVSHDVVPPSAPVLLE